jgi:dienelactone hydrolase
MACKEKQEAHMYCSFKYSASVLTLVVTAALAHAQTPSTSTSTVTLKAPDGIALKATYFSPGRPGPGILLLHQCNRDRTAWTGLAAKAAERGYHVLALDYRGFGESEGQRFDDFQQQQPIVTEKWPGDIDAAFAWLISQNGVDRDRIAAAGASCGVNQSMLLARRHPEVKTLVLLSGGSTPDGRDYLRRTPGLPVFAAASLDDGNAVDGMKWILGWSRHEHNKFVEFKAAGHGTDMFAAEKGLPPMILEWFDARLRTAPATLPAPASPPPPTAVEEFWTALTTPGGVARARQVFEDSKRRDPKAVLFPEGEANLYGYSLLQAGNTKDAIGVFELNVAAYPHSANTYDSLSDAHLAAGNKDEALRLAEKALAVLATDEHVNPDFAALIRESAEKKINELKKK